MLKHRYPMTPERAKRVGESYRQMFAYCQMMLMEYDKYMDTDFKSQAVNNHIKSMIKSIDFIMSKHKVAVDTSAEINILDGLYDLNRINKMFLGMQTERITVFADNMEAELKKEQEGEEAA